MTITIRTATPDDAAGIVAVFNPIIESGKYTVFDKPFTVEAERAYIESQSERDIFHVAEEMDTQRIVGFQSMSPFASLFGAFDHVGSCGTFVDPAYQRRGIAKKLFVALFAVAPAKDYEKIFTYVRADNPGALATYQNHGFQIVGTAQKQAKINGQYIDEIIIEKWL